MSDILDYDNKVWRVLSKLASTVILGVLWIICSIPLFTIGASSTAFYYAYNKSVRQERGYAWQEFWEGFKTNFKQATKIWVPLLVFFVITLIDCFILHSMRERYQLAGLFIVGLIVFLVIALAWNLYIFPYLARFQNETKDVIKNAGLIALANLPWTMLLLVVFIVSAFVFFMFPVINILVPAIYIFVANRIQENVFRKYMTQEDLEREKEFLQHTKR